MKPKVGLYFITRCLGQLAIYRYTSVSADGGTSATSVKYCDSFEEAVREMYRLNGWREPKGGFKFDNN